MIAQRFYLALAALILALASAYIGALSERYSDPYCPTKDSCRIGYYGAGTPDGSDWVIVQDSP